jgi:hypothetical protein
LVEVCPWNLVTYSNDFLNAAWLKSNINLTSGQTDKDGGTNAWKVDFAGSANSAYMFQELPAGQKTGAVWVKGTAGQTAFIGIRGSVASGALFTFNGSWQQVVETSTDLYFIFSNYSAGTATTFLMQYVQANIGSTAKPYFPTTDRLNVPRLTYQNGGGGCPSLLLEKQSTNLVIESEQLNLWNGANASVTANTSVSPDGTQNADNVNITATNGYWRRNPLTFANSTSYTASIFVKKSVTTGTKTFKFYYNNNQLSPNNGVWGCVIDLTNITATTTADGTAGTGIPTILSTNIVDYGSGWYRVEVAFTTGSAAGNSGSEIGFEANGVVVDFLAWGAQVEESSYPTSYIPTTSASATRVADLSTSDTIQTAQTFAGDFTIFADFVPFIDSTDGNGLMILGGGASGLGATYQSYLWFVGSNVYLSGDGEVNIIQRSYSMVVNQRVKIAFTRVGTTVKMFVNGAQVGASNTSSLSITIRSIGWSYNLPTYQTKGKINQVVLSATGFSDADCQSLTTI